MTFGGTIKALSLVIIIRDNKVAEVYRSRGGIQLADHIALTDSGAKYVPFPHDELFSNVGRVIHAVNIAVDPVIRTKEPSVTSESEPSENAR
jgi:hypothetical protein